MGAGLSVCGLAEPCLHHLTPMDAHFSGEVQAPIPQIRQAEAGLGHEGSKHLRVICDRAAGSGSVRLGFETSLLFR